ncbi:recombinase XerD [Halobacteria archaeon AArc-dxtr1]|nr:recombinase XerD [Halobacteria archaeon AArc-dxtr1]
MSDIVIADAVDAYLARKATGDPDENDAGVYASNAGSILRRWAAWLESERDCTALFALEDGHLRSYAERLRALVREGSYAASTAQTYFAVVRAFLAWCVRGGLLETNPAATAHAQEPLPAVDGDSSGDADAFDERRQRLVGYVSDRAAEATDADRRERLSKRRDHALVSLLAHSDVRGSEVFRVPTDGRRDGATWDDVDFYAGTMQVRASSNSLEQVVLPAAARTPLRRYRILQQPPTPDWPLFPTRHAPSVASHVRSVLRDRGLSTETVDDVLAESTAIDVARERRVPPPAVTTEGARSILKRLSADAGIEGEHLTPRRMGAAAPESEREATTPSKTTLRSLPSERSIVLLDDHRNTAPDTDSQ